MDTNNSQKKQTYLDKLYSILCQSEQEEFTLKELQHIFKKFELEEYKKKVNNNKTMSFGKYKGKTLESIAKFDMGYLRWLSKQQPIMERFTGLNDGLNQILRQ